jgi:hypothetical protein
MGTSRFIGLRAAGKAVYSASMKLAAAILVYVLIGLVLSAGILMVLSGKPWLLIAALLAYIVAFARIGCLSH